MSDILQSHSFAYDNTFKCGEHAYARDFNEYNMEFSVKYQMRLLRHQFKQYFAYRRILDETVYRLSIVLILVVSKLIVINISLLFKDVP